jgi:magnesium transporter
MAESLNTSSDKIGFPPGSIIHVGDVHQTETRVSVIDYSAEHVEKRQIANLDDILKYQGSESVTWVIIEGLANAELVGRLGELFAIHPLVVEDILTAHQRPKFEEYEHYLYIVMKSLLSENEYFAVDDEQISILLLEKIVFVFKEKTDELFHPLVQRIEKSKGRFRSMGADYLAYAILVIVVDRLFVLIDSLDEAINSIEDALIGSEPSRDILLTIQRLKKELIHIRRFVSPIREVMAEMLRSESELIREKTRIYLRDVSDHAIRIVESIESYKDILSTLMDIYISSVSNKLNEVMKVLTVFASIFIPLTFLAGIYGMNFEHMPELHWRYAYPALWAIFIATPILLLSYFKKKKWL